MLVEPQNVRSPSYAAKPDIDDICTMADRALSQLTASPDREKAGEPCRDWKTIEEQIATAQGNDLLALLRGYLEINLEPGNDLARLYISRISAILSTIAPDEAAIRADEREKCAKIVTSRVEGMELQRFVFNGVTSTDTRGNDLFIAKSDVEKLLNDRAATIRSQEAGR